ncbi:hypothetical protein JQX13_15210 [Archangium violaceum]|uniref:HEAT repeat domain-containing protein n=1 Tax=Archangium violaceum TaxID=83451 RepID=UPI00193C8443|nr:HEAT repeat domain-containing protein [Archangium violaceum]QRK11301.1 hypothetical protein JQX13_15210 [Archangium violaceum]
MFKTLLGHPDAEQFIREFQEEHQSEVEFLLRQRQRCFHAPDRSWLDAEQMEARLDRHMDALRAGGHVALRSARQLIAEGDMGQFMAAVHVLASLAPEESSISRVLEVRIESDEELLPSWFEAIALARHPEWVSVCIQAALHERPLIRATAARLLGYRREGEHEHLIRLLREDADSKVRSTAALSLAHLGYGPALPLVEQSLSHLPPDDAEPMLRAALLLGSSRALQVCRQLCQSNTPSPPLVRLLALAGREQDVPLLRRLCARSSLASSAFEALGILGIASTIPELIEHLASPQLALRLAAASALALVTGAGLTQKVHIPDEEDEDAPDRAVEQPSTDEKAWRHWWKDHASHFQKAMRFRHGRPFSPTACLDELEAARSSFQVRARATLELALLLGQAPSIEPDWPIHRQRQVLVRWRRLLRTK